MLDTNRPGVAPVKRILDIWLAIHKSNKALEKQFGVSLVQLQILKTVHSAPEISPKELAQSIGSHASSLTPLLQRLTSRNLIFVDNDPRDYRKKTVILTREGLQMIQKSEDSINHSALQLLEGICSKETIV